MTNSATQSANLQGIVVLDLTGHLSQMCARMLGDLGADVIKVEPPGGDPARMLAPFAGDIPDPERSLRFIDANRNKRSVVLDFRDNAEDRKRLRALAERADVLVEDYPPGYLASIGLGYPELRERNPGLIHVSVTPFGQTGPHAGWRGGELIAEAAGGMMFANGDDAAPPCMAPFDLIAQIASVHAAFGALMALRSRRLLGGHGQMVDVSRQEIVLWLQNSYISRYQYQKEITRREGAHTAFGAVNTYHSMDGGYVNVSVYSSEHFSRLAREIMEHPVLSEPVWMDRTVRRENRELIDSFVEEYAGTITRDAFVERGQRGGIPIVPLLRLEEFVEHPQVAERGYLVDEQHPVVGRYRAAGPPIRFGSGAWRDRAPVPLLGQHTQEVLDELSRPSTKKPVPSSASAGRPEAAPPLKGVRVVDLTRAHAGYIAAMYLGFFGAEVIKIESDGLEDPRTPGQTNYADMNRNKLSCTIDARTPDGRKTILDLVAKSDVVVEHFRPGVMKNLGLSYEDLKRVNPKIILLSMPGLGSTGPLRGYRSYGQQIMGMTGLTHLWGHPDGALNTRIKMPFPDYVAALLGALSTVVALEHRDRTGEGQAIEIAQLEGMAHFLGVGILDYTVNGRAPEPQGNRRVTHAPHDVYPCLGVDAWSAIAVEDDEQWRALSTVMGSPAWASEDRFGTLLGRVEHKHDLDAKLGEWTRQFTPRQVARMLQAVGVPASAVATAEDLYHDVHLRARHEGIVAIDHPGHGTIEHQGINIHLSATPGTATIPAPAKGEHNGYVFGEILGLTEARRKELVENGALR
ncbi:MAG: CoA transferase [Chloroflexi bacterium]|nr:CoA transferase [Chloroflexota bacterium]